MEPHNVIAAIWGSILGMAALSDLRSFRIPNIFPITLILLFVGVQGLGGFSGAQWANFLHFLLALIIGMALFSRGWVGGGDAKLYAAAALWFDWQGAVALIFLTGIAGLLLALALIAAPMVGLRKNVAKDDRRIPYGVAIAAGAILTAAWSGWAAIFPVVS
jgi:prepilin peptidase CpaA